MKRTLLYTALILSGIVVLTIVIMAGWLVTTEAGLAWLFPKIAGYLPPEVSVKSIHGRLIGPLSIEELRYQSATLAVSLDKAEINWTPRSLLYGKVSVSSLNAEGLFIRSTGEKHAPAPVHRLPDISLPFSVAIDNALIKNIAIAGAAGDDGPAPSPFVVNELSFGAGIGWNVLHISRLQVITPFFALRLNGDITPRGNYSTDIQTAWVARTSQFPEVKGNGTIKGTLRSMKIAQQLTAPLKAKIEVTANDLLTHPYWKTALEARSFNLRELNSRWPDVQVYGKLQGAGEPARFTAGGALNVSTPGFENTSVTFDLLHEDTTWPKWILRSVAVAVPGKGEVRGNLALEGPAGDYRFSSGFDIAGKNIPSSRWVLRGRGSADEVILTTLHANVLQGELNGDADIRRIKGSKGENKGIEWHAALSGAGLNPGAQWPKWPGRLEVQAATSGAFDKKLQAAIAVRRMSGELRGYPFSSSLSAKIDGKNYSLSALDITSGGTHMSVSGSVSDTLNLNWTIDAQQLGTFVPEASGVLAAKGTLRGARNAPLIAATIKGKALSYKAYTVDTADAALGVDLHNTTDSHIALRMDGISLNKLRVDALDVHGAGKIADHQVALFLRSGGETVNATVRGSYREKNWQGLLLQSGLVSKQWGKWVLEQPGPLRINAGKGALQAGQWCWSNAASRVCLQTDWKGNAGSHIAFAAKRIPLAVVHPFILTSKGTVDAGITGTFDCTATADYYGKTLTGQLNLVTSNGVIVYSLAEKSAPATLAFMSSSVTARLAANTLDAKIVIPLADGGHVQGTVLLPGFSPFDFSSSKQIIRGNITAEMRRLDVIPVFLPELENTGGVFKADITATGTVAKPSLSGRIMLEQVRADVRKLGIRFSDTSLTASISPDGSTTVRGQIKSGPGTLAIEGAGRLGPKEGEAFTLHIKGQRFEAMKTTEAHIIASPDLTAMVKGQRIDVAGEVVVPEASIKSPDRSQAVPVSSDVVIVNGGEQKKTKKQWNIYSRVRITMGDKVTFSGFGLSGGIQGSIIVIETPQQLTNATGELTIVNGKYKVYGQTLTIDRGRLLFAGGPLSNPSLDARAIRTAGEVTAGLSVQGSLKNPRATLFSTPPMEQADILSYLIIGGPLQQASSSQGSLLVSAARSLSLSGGEFLAKRIGRIFGIEQIGIEQVQTQSQALSKAQLQSQAVQSQIQGQAPGQPPAQAGTLGQTAALVLGTHLSPRLYISYSIGVFEALSRVRLRYDLSRKFQIQVESGTQTGADIIYKFEK